MIVFSKTGCPYSKKLKALLTNSYTFSPSYHVVELDRHEHTKELQDQIEKVTGKNESKRYHRWYFQRWLY